MRAVDRILGAHARALDNPELPKPSPDGYVAFTDTAGHPQTGFVLHRKDGRLDAFFFHNIDNLDIKGGRDAEFLNFTHRGKAVTLKGQKLTAILALIMGHTLTHIFEHPDGPRADIDAAIVEKVAVTMLNGAPSDESDQA